MLDIKRPSYDEWYLFMAFWISRRSPDPSTKHGCVFVDKHNRPISFGYNGCPPNTKDDKGILSNRPLKYYIVIHSEENAIINASKSLRGSTAYITGEPCSRCLSKLISAGVSRIVCGATRSKCIVDDVHDREARSILLRDHDIKIEMLKMNMDTIRANIDAIFGVIEGN